MPNSLFSSDHTDHSSQAAGHLNPIEEKKKELDIAQQMNFPFWQFVHTDGTLHLLLLHQISLFTACKKVYCVL